MQFISGPSIRKRIRHADLKTPLASQFRCAFDGSMIITDVSRAKGVKDNARRKISRKDRRTPGYA